MRQITIDKARLLETLKVNQKAHDEAFHEASAAFYDKFGKELEAVAEHVVGGELNYTQALRDLQRERPPQGHCDEYEVQIKMLEFSTEETISLTQDEFERFVLDEWHWKEEFAGSYLSVTGKSL